MRSYNIYCVSNASTDFYHNTLTGFSNFFPQNFELTNNKWEIGVVAFGLHLNIEEDSETGVIQVKSDITAFTKAGYSSILYTTSLPNSKKGEYFYHSAENVRYFPLRNTSLNSIRLEIIDAAERRLALKAGQPTIVQFHLRRRSKRMSTNHIQIDSKMDDNISPNQKNNNFEVHLKKPIYLKKNAKIALTGISFPNNLLNIPKLVSERKIVISSEPRNFELNMFPEQVDESENRELFNKYINFETTLDRSDQHHFKITYIAPFIRTETFKPPMVRIDFPETVKYFCQIEGDVVLGENNETFEAPRPLLASFSTPNLKMQISIEPFQAYLRLNEGIYKTPSTFMRNINSNMDVNLRSLLGMSYDEGHFKIYQYEKARNYKLKINFEIANEIKKILGINLDESVKLDEENQEFTSPRPLDINALYPGLMVCYTDFVKHSIIGDEYYRILKMIPLPKLTESDNYVSMHFENLEFFRCNTTRLDKLTFQLKRIDGEFIEFNDNGKIIMSLAIQNRK